MTAVHVAVNVVCVTENFIMELDLMLENQNVVAVQFAFLQMEKSQMKMGTAKQWMNFKLETEYRQVSDSITWNVNFF